MIKIYKTEESIVNEIEKVEDGCWINMITPTIFQSVLTLILPMSEPHWMMRKVPVWI